MATLDDINILPEARFLTLDDKMAIAEQGDRRSPKRISVRQLTTLMELGNPARGQVNVLSNATPTDITAIDSFVEAGINGVLDTDTDVNFTALTGGRIGLRYTGSDTRIFWCYGSYDGTAGNNHLIGIRLAKNGNSIPETESRANTGSHQQEVKLICLWMISLSTNDTLSIQVANGTNHDITIKRARLVANAIS